MFAAQGYFRRRYGFTSDAIPKNAAYLFMFTPMVIGMFGIMFHQLSAPVAVALRKRRERTEKE